jgi:adenosylcobinamide kinase/adenosylcobinamide-phosphate guanylyltransferase
MALVVLIGGARSGKSRLAVELARASGHPVTVVATGEARDEEMAARIAAHQAERPAGWETIEEPYELERVLASVAPGRVVIVDCLSLWVANALERGDAPDAIVETARRVAGDAASRVQTSIGVSNEVGLGIVPGTPLGRLYRDVLGSVNRVWVDVAGEALLVVAGRALRLEAAADLTGSSESSR